MKRFAAAVLAGCQLFTDDVVQCKTNEDCESRGGEFAGSVCQDNVCTGSTACRGKIVWEAEDTSRKVHTHVRFVNSAEKPVAGVKAVLCAKLDPNCERPSEPTISDADGYALVEVPFAFRGQIRVNEPPPGFDETFMKTGLVTYPPVVKDETKETVVPSYAAVRLFSRTELDLLLALRGLKTEPGKSHVFGEVVDCNARPLRGATIDAVPADPDRVLFLGDDSDTPSPTQKVTAGSAIFTFFNAVSGTVNLQATYGNQLWSRVELVTIPDVIMTLQLPPSP